MRGVILVLKIRDHVEISKNMKSVSKILSLNAFEFKPIFEDHPFQYTQFILGEKCICSILHGDCNTQKLPDPRWIDFSRASLTRLIRMPLPFWSNQVARIDVSH